MNPGRMDRRVTIGTYAPTQDSAGGITEAWTTLATVWASKRELPGKEFQANGQINAQHQVEWAIRYRTDVTPQMTLTYESEIYDIVSVSEIGRKDGLRLTAIARA